MAEPPNCGLEAAEKLRLHVSEKKKKKAFLNNKSENARGEIILLRGPRRNYHDHINSLAVRLFSQFFFFNSYALRSVQGHKLNEDIFPSFTLF